MASRFACSALAWLVCGGFMVYAGSPISDDEFRALHAALAPTKETWKTIPWRVDLLGAQNEAARQRKLLLIWTMDGHPLGCT